MHLLSMHMSRGYYFSFCQTGHKKVDELSLRASYNTENKTKNNNAILGVLKVDRGSAYFKQTCLLVNLVQILLKGVDETNNYSKCWHYRLNKKAIKHNFRMYKLLYLLIAKQCVAATLVNNFYAKTKRLVQPHTGKYIWDSRTIEEVLSVLTYCFPESCSLLLSLPLTLLYCLDAFDVTLLA
ncbi:hypothetical protein T4B_6840 [Trichinella pseudospiralis]|uniref:Uncharacterized protein n=2 Tax=Trichinella pseudospiralis TaxID=6337 RepID=A0A0V1IHN5_TRIPS|nr:hypothetical protein T4B_6840 [Trichinella pseudospiralis]